MNRFKTMAGLLRALQTHDHSDFECLPQPRMGQRILSFKCKSCSFEVYSRFNVFNRASGPEWIFKPQNSPNLHWLPTMAREGQYDAWIASELAELKEDKLIAFDCFGDPEYYSEELQNPGDHNIYEDVEGLTK